MKLITTLAALAALTACSGEAVDTPAAADTTQTSLDRVERSVHDVKCGCKIESVGHCGNYVFIEGQPIVISQSGEGGKLGAMEWCAVDGAKAEVEGDLKDGEFVATYIKQVEA